MIFHAASNPLERSNATPDPWVLRRQSNSSSATLQPIESIESVTDWPARQETTSHKQLRFPSETLEQLAKRGVGVGAANKQSSGREHDAIGSALQHASLFARGRNVDEFRSRVYENLKSIGIWGGWLCERNNKIQPSVLLPPT